MEDAISCTVSQEQGVPQVLTAEEKEGVLKLTNEVIDGVYTMSADLKDLVESSSSWQRSSTRSRTARTSRWPRCTPAWSVAPLRS